ncbi:hypothetical protein SAMN05216176_1287 [Nitratireductor indicus]|nr:hypothetical protein SAMN05216176_1287 [Nitratireductor indicus]
MSTVGAIEPAAAAFSIDDSRTCPDVAKLISETAYLGPDADCPVAGKGRW